VKHGQTHPKHVRFLDVQTVDVFALEKGEGFSERAAQVGDVGDLDNVHIVWISVLGSALQQNARFWSNSCPNLLDGRDGSIRLLVKLSTSSRNGIVSIIPFTFSAEIRKRAVSDVFTNEEQRDSGFGVPSYWQNARGKVNPHLSLHNKKTSKSSRFGQTPLGGCPCRTEA
jgi:hypothetical protein